MTWIVFFFLNWTPLAQAEAPLCLDLFRMHSSFNLNKKADRIYTTQSAIGRVYAETKLLEKSGFGRYASVHDLSGKDLKSLEKYVDDLLQEGLPAVLSPHGEIFIIDGHHDLYALVLLGKPLNSEKVKLDIVKDYQEEGFSEDQFHQDLIDREWADAESVQKTPKLIDQLSDSPERSLAGLSFLSIAQKFSIPMVGKHFIPRVQFKLIDEIKKLNLYAFDNQLDQNHIEKFSEVILTQPSILQFLIDSLNPDSSKKLRKFLIEKQQEALQN
jgi:hypothetical protein